jgi:hypothetical protein
MDTPAEAPVYLDTPPAAVPGPAVWGVPLPEDKSGGCATCGGGGGGANGNGNGGWHSREHPFLNRCGLGCWSHHFQPTCSSLHSELTFIFGSCRAFFGEPCLPRPPMVPVPPGYQPFPYSTR